MTMRTPLFETPPKEEEEKEDRETKKTASGFENHLGPKTKETELRLGFSSNGFEDMGSVESGDQNLCGFALKQRNSGFGGKRWFSETEGVFANPWRQEKTVYKQTHHQQRMMDTSPVPRAPPVVGWPPVRAFRKNLTPQQPRLEEMEAKAISTSLVEASKKAAEEESMFVKVNMEGCAVGRKINLKAHNSYESLSTTLQKMFNNFFAINYFKSEEMDEEDEIVNSDHVLIYEDNEGDRILVGDVPWEMFISTVKRLYIISGSRAPSLVFGRAAAAKDQQ